MDNLQDKYKLLEVSESSSLEDIKRSYRRLCLKYHPDKCNGCSEKFIQIKNAYDEIIQRKERNINFFIMMYYFILRFNKSNNITITLEISMEEIYNSSIKKLTYYRINEQFQKEKCVFYLELFGYQDTYEIKGKGDYSILTQQYGDLILNLTINNHGFEHYVLNKIVNLYDVYTTVDINLYEYYYGVKKTIKHFNNEQIYIDNYVPHLEGDTQVLYGKGLPDEKKDRTNLYIFYKVDLNRIDKYEINEDIIKNIFNK